MFEQKSGFLFIVSGPAGIGKTTVCDQMLKEIAGVERAVTSTTREPRRGEIDTVDYYFFDHDTFQAKIDAGAFYEYAQCITNSTAPSKVKYKANLPRDRPFTQHRCARCRPNA